MVLLSNSACERLIFNISTQVFTNLIVTVNLFRDEDVLNAKEAEGVIGYADIRREQHQN